MKRARKLLSRILTKPIDFFLSEVNKPLDKDRVFWFLFGAALASLAIAFEEIIREAIY
jgi:hypothetical protein